DLAPELLLDLAYTFAPVVEQAGAWSTWSRFLETIQDTAEGKDRLRIQLHLGTAQRWLAQWDEAGHLLVEFAKRAGQIGAFDLQAHTMVELAAIYHHQARHELAGQLLRRANDFYRRTEYRPGLERVAAEFT